jgi:hypothetical protein
MPEGDPKKLPAVEDLIFTKADFHSVIESRTLAVQVVTKEVIEAKRQEFALPKQHQFATPARQESVRVALVVCGTIAWGVVGNLLGFPERILGIGLLVIGGIYGLSKIGTKSRTPDVPSPVPSLPPAD